MKFKVGDLVRVKIMEGFFASAHYKKGEVFIVNKVSQYNEGQRLSKKDYGVYVMESEVEPVTHLTTKEFVKLVEDMGYEVKKYTDKLIVKENGKTLSYVIRDDINMVCTSFSYTIHNSLFNIMILYASTPLELREEKEKLYTLELPNNKSRLRFYNQFEDEYMFNRLEYCSTYKTHFTQKEIDNLPNQELIKTLIKKEVMDNK